MFFDKGPLSKNVRNSISSKPAVYFPSDPMFLLSLDEHASAKMSPYPRLLDQWRYCAAQVKQNQAHSALAALYSKVEASMVYEPQIRSIAGELIRSIGGSKKFLGLHYRGNEFDQYDGSDSPRRISQYFSRLLECIKGNKTPPTHNANKGGS